MAKTLTVDEIAVRGVTRENFRETMYGFLNEVAARGKEASLALADDVEAGRLTQEQGLAAGFVAARYALEEPLRRVAVLRTMAAKQGRLTALRHLPQFASRSARPR